MGNMSDYFCAIIHLIMIQEGFSNNSVHTGIGIPFEKQTQYCSVLSYNNLKVTSKLNYNLSKCVKIMINSMDRVNMLTIQAFHDKFKTRHVIKVSTKQNSLSSSPPFSVSTDSNDKELREFCINYKDSLVSELVMHLYGDLNLQSSFFQAKNLVFLPTDILTKIVVQFLNVNSIGQLSQTSKFFHMFLFNRSSTLLWKDIFSRDFKDKHSSTSSDDDLKNWLVEYKNQMLLRRRLKNWYRIEFIHEIIGYWKHQIVYQNI